MKLLIIDELSMVSSDLWTDIDSRLEEIFMMIPEKVLRQNSKVFVDFLNKVWVGNIDDDAENLLKARFIHGSNENYPKDALHLYAENKPAIKRNETILNELPGELYTIGARYPLVLTLRLLRIKGKQTQEVRQSCSS